MVPLSSHVAHHQLAGVSGPELGQPDIFHRVGQTLHALLHLPAAAVIPLQDGDADVGALGGGVQHSGILFPIAIQILQQER